jgi:hypothetical protein
MGTGTIPDVSWSFHFLRVGFRWQVLPTALSDTGSDFKKLEKPRFEHKKARAARLWPFDCDSVFCCDSELR